MMSQDWAAPWAQKPFQVLVIPCLDYSNTLTAWLCKDGASWVEYTGRNQEEGLDMRSGLGRIHVNECQLGKLCSSQHRALGKSGHIILQ